jgi:hypothetical protein
VAGIEFIRDVAGKYGMLELAKFLGNELEKV